MPTGGLCIRTGGRTRRRSGLVSGESRCVALSGTTTSHPRAAARQWRRPVDLSRSRRRRLPMSTIDPELPLVNGGFRQFGAHGWQEPDGVRMRQADGPFGGLAATKQSVLDATRMFDGVQTMSVGMDMLIWSGSVDCTGSETLLPRGL